MTAQASMVCAVMFDSPLSGKQISELRDFALELAGLAADETLPRFRAGITVQNKQSEDFDPVTDADREAERVIRERIEAQYPEHGILGEEFGEKSTGSDFRWVLDPVDGTRAFVCGVPSWTTLIALEYQHTPLIGVISQPYMNENWVGAPGDHGTILHRPPDETACRASAETDLAAARVTTSDPRPEAYFSDAEAAAFANIASKCRLARFGLDAYGYAVLASGQFELVIEAGLQRYDAAALVPVVQAAHGLVTDWRGNPIGPDWEKPFDQGGQRGRIIAAANRSLLDQALKILSQVPDT